MAIDSLAPAYVVDTHVLIWVLTDNKKLSSEVRKIFEVAEQTGKPEFFISAIVIAEMFWTNKKHRMFADFVKTYAELKARSYVRLFDFLPDDVLELVDLATIPDMHDRIIVGLAKRLGAPLITADEKIVAAGVVPVVHLSRKTI